MNSADKEKGKEKAETTWKKERAGRLAVHVF